MRMSQAALAACVVLTGLAADSASAGPPRKPPPLCNLVVDDKKDDATGSPIGPVPLPNNPDLDVVTGDIASNGRTIAVAMRLAALGTSDQEAPTGRVYTFSWKVGAQGYSLVLTINNSGEIFVNNAAAKYAFDTARKEIRMWIDHAALTPPPVAKAGTRYQDMVIRTNRWGGYQPQYPSTSFPQSDEAKSTKFYPAQASSCLPIGR